MRFAPARGSSGIPGLLALGLVAAVLNPSPGFASYAVEFVPGVHGATRPSLKLDATDQPRIAFGAIDEAPQVLRFAAKDGGTWSTELVDTLANAVDWPLPMVMETGDVPVIAYTRASWDLRTAERTGPGAWTIERNFAHGGGRWGAFGSDALGVRSVVYADGLLGVESAHRSTLGVWSGHDVLPDQSTIASEVQLAIGPANDLRAVFQFTPVIPGPRLYYSELVGGQWTYEPVFPSQGADIGVALAVAGDGASAFSYRYAGTGVALAHRDAPNNWSVEFLDPQGTGPTSLAYDTSGRAHVAYLKGGAIWQGIRLADSWLLEPVTAPDAGASDGSPSLTLDSQGVAWIAFVRSTPLEGGGTDRALGVARDESVLGVVPSSGVLPGEVNLESVAPQPTSGQGRIAFRLARPASVTLELRSASGRIVARSALGTLGAGPQVRAWSPGGIAAGVYFLRVVTGSGAADTRRWVVLP